MDICIGTGKICPVDVFIHSMTLLQYEVSSKNDTQKISRKFTVERYELSSGDSYILTCDKKHCDSYEVHTIGVGVMGLTQVQRKWL
jgi:hypothetical protein